MINHIQKLHETKHSIEERISKIEKIMSNPQTKLTDYCNANWELKKLKINLESNERSLRDLL